MSVKWTEEQQKVIELRDRNILVSAAAGSGKTAVLVERIIRKLTDEVHPVDVDRLLIVTFTEAAAAEMKERIRDAVEKQLDERRGDTHLERQAALVHSAPITTIHSFCLSVIRDHFHVIGIDPGFRIGEEGELKLLKQDVLDELLEACYAEGGEEFLAFAERFGTGRTDKKIEDILLRLYEYSRGYPRPDRWLDSCVDAYCTGKTGAEPDRDLAECAKEQALLRIQDLKQILRQGLKICELPDGPYMYGDALEADLEEAGKMERCTDYDRLSEAAGSFLWKRLSAKKDETVSPEKKEAVKKLREQAKKLLKEIREAYFYAPRQSWERTMDNARGSMQTLAALTRRFAEMFREKKRSRNMIDFNDMEQYALAILTVEEDGRLVPSPVAQEYQERFEEVMIDEYQDSNLVQEAILTSVSGVSQGRYNIFMVGDVKQSIYSFRLSRPELFMEKYHTYSLADSRKQRIDLHKNFRSRAEVLDSVNAIFRQIMKKELGGIVYDDSAALYPGAAFPEPPGESSFRTELLLVDKEDAGEEGERRAEARMIARRIRELTAGAVVTDRETGGYRRVRYRDIVILTRSIKGWAEDFAAVLAEEGIPAYSVSREGYFETYEVSVLLDYLRILDNARQDLPLAAVLTSCFAGLDEEELAQIRIACPNLPFYEAAARYAEGLAGDGQDEAHEQAAESGARRAGDLILQRKLRMFYRQAESFRKRVPYTPIHDLLAQIIEETGYGLWITAMPGGAQRRANVDMLAEKAAAFEGTSYKGLFNFVRYIEQLKKYDVDYGEAGIMDEQADTVRIMSIHKSKGLEFPVVFAAGMGKRFNTQDTRGSMLLHPEWGVGLDDIDIERRTKNPTFLKKMIQQESVREILAEEQRILYVALTRAREKLIMTGSITASALEAAVGAGSLSLPGDARSCLDWILPAVLTAGAEGGGYPAVQEKEEVPVDVRFFSGLVPGPGPAEAGAEELALSVLENWDCTGVYVPELREQLEEQMNYVYPQEAEGRMKLKFTVSELKKRSVLAEEAGQEMYEEPETVPLIPRFLREEEESLTGASRGSAYHKLLELLDFTKDYGEEELAEAVAALSRAGRLSPEMAACIRPGDILRFLSCRSGRRMAAAACRGQLFREQPFVLGVDASEIYPGDESGETILVQGIIDVYFEEPDGLVVLDYKTDRVKQASELQEKYHAQLDYYAQALAQLLGKPVKEKILYSFTLGKEIQV